MRWQAIVTYRCDAAGPLQVMYDFEELDELHNLIERGPNWNCIIDIVITLTRSTSPNLTLEAAEKL